MTFGRRAGFALFTGSDTSTLGLLLLPEYDTMPDTWTSEIFRMQMRDHDPRVLCCAVLANCLTKKESPSLKLDRTY